MQYLILKVRQRNNIKYYSQCDWQRFITGGWRVKPCRLIDVDDVLILYSHHIVAHYRLGDDITFNRSNNRCYLQLLPTSNHQYVGATVNYRTFNPATIVGDDKVIKMINSAKE